MTRRTQAYLDTGEPWRTVKDEELTMFAQAGGEEEEDDDDDDDADDDR